VNRKKALLLTALVLAAATVLVVLAFLPNEGRRLRSTKRKQWKEQSLAELRGQLGNSKGLSNELARLRAAAQDDSERGWVGTNLLVMANGEWLAFRNRCVKEPGNLHDIFLAHGSDGKWYYSTFHFCTGMIVLRGGYPDGDSHESLPVFIRAFALREFDGASDECLAGTWPPKR
jgi:hypothetical protein